MNFERIFYKTSLILKELNNNIKKNIKITKNTLIN